ncbi:16S rRNA (cytidine(1402)-2'-O)-methyltransferase [Candidatus Falkowbacteria bacterium]|nr:16S rRNA (cytidine(1402)-2'-O)-methyltransferase [Candidatus Falkowbacteria bacterium]
MLYIVATPIGNLEDISLRALRILGEVDFILCEDTRVTGKLLHHYKIKTPAISYHQHTDEKKLGYILSLLEKGKDLALVTDAGTPGISDPGGKLIQAVIEKFNDQMKIESVPGPSAVTAALSISGIPTDKFIFMGFPPHKKGRQAFLKKILASEWPVVVYESKHRIIKFLEELKNIAENNDSAKTQKHKNTKTQKQISNFQFPISKQYSIANNQNLKTEEQDKKTLQSIVVCRELSKMHETVYRGEIKNIIKKIKESHGARKGEFVVIIGK